METENGSPDALDGSPPGGGRFNPAAVEATLGMEDFYDLLGVSEDASADEIDQAWRERVHQYHPDVNDDTRATAQFKTLERARGVLTDETERAAYDRLGHEAYVRERLDGLPNARSPADGATETTDSGETAARTDRTGGPEAQRTAAAGDDRDATGSASSETTGEGAQEQPTAGTESRERHPSDAEANEQTAAAHAGDTGSTATDSRRRPHRPLAYAWGAVALVAAVYLVGVWSYLGANAAAVSTLLDAASTSPSVAMRAQEFVPPVTFAADALATMAVGRVAFGVGTIGLAVGFGAVVARFGRGTAALYAVGGATPLAALVIGSLTGVPDGVVVLLMVVVPVVTVVSFLLDVGWVLATQ